MVFDQPTESRTAAETVSEIKSQLITATRGVAAPVDAMQTATGVKDPIAQHWINLMIAKSRVSREERLTNPVTRDPRLNLKTSPARQAIREDIEKQIKDELLQWLTQQPSHRYEKIPEDSG